LPPSARASWRPAWENDKPTVVALREIAAGLVDYDVIAQDELIEEESLFGSFDDEANEPL
jgi:DNA-directed RNA polymerase subunit omega